MKITIVLDDGTRHKANRPHSESTYVTIPHACPACAKAAPVRISGTGIEHTSRDTYFAGAVALCCKKWIGTIETKVDTMFGIEEDERVTNGPWKVY